MANIIDLQQLEADTDSVALFPQWSTYSIVICIDYPDVDLG